MAITERRQLGDIGENAACAFLEKHGFKIMERNYLRKWGELDIVASKTGKIHFVEVKSARLRQGYGGQVSREPKSDVSRGTYRPEENVHPQKLKRLARAIQTYILERRLDGCDWQFDIITAKIDLEARQARLEMLENIVIS